jgi:hypothetical protein
MLTHNNLTDDGFLASPADLADILAMMKNRPRRDVHKSRIVKIAAPVLSSRAMPANSASPKQQATVVVGALGPAGLKHPKRERLTSEILTTDRSRDGRESRIVKIAAPVLSSRAMPADSASPKQQATVVVGAREPAGPKHPKRERLIAEILTLLQAKPVIHPDQMSFAH